MLRRDPITIIWKRKVDKYSYIICVLSGRPTDGFFYSRRKHSEIITFAVVDAAATAVHACAASWYVRWSVRWTQPLQRQQTPQRRPPHQQVCLCVRLDTRLPAVFSRFFLFSLTNPQIYPTYPGDSVSLQLWPGPPMPRKYDGSSKPLVVLFIVLCCDYV